ncbi:MAG: manganese efflux pump MntP family protein [Firmicutes bacterium]|nr:manganese efflux pump MntP family protein [Bacillota bacterium]
MSIPQLFLLALALAMDAFAVAICIGLTAPKFRIRNAVIVGLYFGVFQAIMPLIGYWAGGVFAERITALDHWIAFAILAFLGVKMIVGSFKNDDEPGKEVCLGVAAMFPLAIATSIDALAAGVTFAFARVSIVPAIVLIGVIAFIMSALGVKLGEFVGLKFKSKAELLGGIILVALAVRVLVERI